jgi:hypothetical protein
MTTKHAAHRPPNGKLKPRPVAGWWLSGIGIFWLGLNALILIGLATLYTAKGVELTDRISRWAIVSPLIIGFLLMLLGFILKEGSKSTLLFLRPFNTLVNVLAMTSIAGRLGNRFSAVALDDGSIPAPKVSAKAILAGLFIFLPMGVVLLFFSAIALPNAMDKLRSPELASATAALPAIFACYFGIFAIGKAFRSIVPKSNKSLIQNVKQLAEATARVEGLSTWLPRMFIPRAVIFQSTHEMWKDAVQDLASRCEVAVIGLSRMSASMHWELTHLGTTMAGKFIIVAEASTALSPEAINCGAPILRYQGSLDAQQEFTGELQVCIDALTAGR